MFEAAKNIKYESLFGKAVESHPPETLHKYFKDNDMTTFSVWHHWHHKINSEIFKKVIEIYEELGSCITKTWKILIKENIKCSRPDVEEVFTVLNHYLIRNNLIIINNLFLLFKKSF